MLKKLPSIYLPAALALMGSAVMNAQTTSASANKPTPATPTPSTTQQTTAPAVSPEETRVLEASLQKGVPAIPMAQKGSPSVVLAQNTQPTSRAGQNGAPATPSSQNGAPSTATLQAPPDTSTPVTVHREPPPAAADLHVAPKDFVENKTVVIPQTGERALRASGAWDASVNPASMGNDGRVIFTFGAGMPVVVCAPLRICVIELEHGEHMVSAPNIGDSVRWDVSLETSGSGDQDTELLILKPRDIGLDTSIFIPTDRRSYYIRLVSKSGAYTPMVAFDYPEDDRAKIEKAILREQQQRQTQVSPVTAPVEALFYDYEIKGKGPFRPVRVMDDGAKTYIEMSPENAHRDLPTLVIEGPGGNELVDYRVKDSYFVVDRLFDKAALLLGAGKHTEKVEIIRQQKLARSKGTSVTSFDKSGNGSY